MPEDDRRSTIPAPPATADPSHAGAAIPTGRLGTGDGYSGEEYDADRHLASRTLAETSRAVPEAGNAPAEDIPDDNGHRAWIDQKTGEVHGSGMGAGGGQAGEDFDDDAASGDGAREPGTEQTPPD